MVEVWLDGDNLVRLQNLIGAGRDAGHLVKIEPDVVTDGGPAGTDAPVDEVAVSRVAEHALGGIVHFAIRDAGGHRVDGGLLGGPRQVVVPLLVCGRLAQGGEPLDVRVVSFVRAAAVELNEAAGANYHLTPRNGVGPQGAVGPCVKDQGPDLAAAAGVHLLRHDAGDLALGYPIADGLEAGLDPKAGYAHRFPKPPDLLIGLDAAHGPDDLSAVAPAGPGQGVAERVEHLHGHAHAEVGARLSGDVGLAQPQVLHQGDHCIHRRRADVAGVETNRKLPHGQRLDPACLGLVVASARDYQHRGQILVPRDEGHPEVGLYHPAHLVPAGGIPHVALLGEQESIDTGAGHLFAQAAQASIELLSSAVSEDAGAHLRHGLRSGSLLKFRQDWPPLAQDFDSASICCGVHCTVSICAPVQLP